ncbi:MAG: DUF488 domain-containing protein [Desulfovibrio sp.]|jgi:hypothetical protein|nr:DUF488 domain-containing protein [Desulfovibrio sp.]
MQHVLHTIGASAYPMDVFVERLLARDIRAIADVRSVPYSAHFKDFCREALKDALGRRGIEYVWMGPQLGGKPDDPEVYDAQGHVDFGRLRGRPCFDEGVERLRRGLGRFPIALMCAEKDPMHCHRAVLIAETIHAEGLLDNEICHIWPHPGPDGVPVDIEGHGGLRDRILRHHAERDMRIAGLPKAQAVVEAVRRHREAMAASFVKPGMSGNARGRDRD